MYHIIKNCINTSCYWVFVSFAGGDWSE